MRSSLVSEVVRIPSSDALLHGSWTLPSSARGVVVFAHGSGSGQRSPRNIQVAEVLQKAGLATLLFDLLTEQEAESYWLRFDIDLLTRRLQDATQWARRQTTQALPLGYFGASTGAAAALRAAAEADTQISAIVSRGGRPDMAGSALERVTAAVLLLVGEMDTEIVEVNRHAYNQLQGARTRSLEVIGGATHLFEEPGAMARVAELASSWFAKHL